MKKIIFSLIILLIFPCIVYADEVETTTVTTTTITESPDTGVEDYFIVLTTASIVLIVTVEILNRKNVFRKI